MNRDIITLIKQQLLPKDSSRYGVVIGVEKYRDERLDLKCAGRDAKAVYDLMIDPDCGMFPEDNVTLLLDDNATKKSVWNALAALRRKVGKNDTVWIYYAGHGASEGGDYYWVLHDSNVDDLYATGLARQEISRVLNDLAAERVVTFLDCCYAAATAVQKNPTRAIETAEELFASYAGKGRVIVSASDGREKSVELADEGHGAFTYFMVRGLKGEADKDGVGIIHLDGLWSYLQDKVSDASRKIGNPQTPVLLGEHSHRLALTLNPLVSEKKRLIAGKIRELVGLDDDNLTTEEASLCLRILRDGPSNFAEQAVCAEFSAMIEDKIKITTFKHLIQTAVSAPAQNESKPLKQKQVETEPKTLEPRFNSESSNIDDLQKKYALTSEQAKSIISAWSANNPQYLNPLSEQMEYVECINSCIYKVQITALTESRDQTLKYEPYNDSTDSVEFAEPIINKWNVDFVVPSGFNESEYVWQSAKPRRILACDSCGGKGEYTCPDCHGSGRWICKECNGTGLIMCLECNGTGKDHLHAYGDAPSNYIVGGGTFSTKRKCLVCHGDKKVPCVDCKGEPKKQCPKCGGLKTLKCEKCVSAGKMAEHDLIKTFFKAEKFVKVVKDNSHILVDSNIVSNTEALPLSQWITEKMLLPEAFDNLPKDIVHEIKQYWNSVTTNFSDKVHRIRISIGFVPCTIYTVKYQNVLLEMNIFGQERRLITPDRLPKDDEYLLREKRTKLETEQKYYSTAYRRVKIYYSTILSIFMLVSIVSTLAGVKIANADRYSSTTVWIVILVVSGLIALGALGWFIYVITAKNVKDIVTKYRRLTKELNG